jgi:hypothetical protein
VIVHIYLFFLVGDLGGASPSDQSDMVFILGVETNIDNYGSVLHSFQLGSPSTSSAQRSNHTSVLCMSLTRQNKNRDPVVTMGGGEGRFADQNGINTRASISTSIFNNKTA